MIHDLIPWPQSHRRPDGSDVVTALNEGRAVSTPCVLCPAPSWATITYLVRGLGDDRVHAITASCLQDPYFREPVWTTSSPKRGKVTHAHDWFTVVGQALNFSPGGADERFLYNPSSMPSTRGEAVATSARTPPKNVNPKVARRVQTRTNSSTAARRLLSKATDAAIRTSSTHAKRGGRRRLDCQRQDRLRARPT